MLIRPCWSFRGSRRALTLLGGEVGLGFGEDEFVADPGPELLCDDRVASVRQRFGSVTCSESARAGRQAVRRISEASTGRPLIWPTDSRTIAESAARSAAARPAGGGDSMSAVIDDRGGVRQVAVTVSKGSGPRSTSRSASRAGRAESCESGASSASASKSRSGVTETSGTERASAATKADHSSV